MKQSGFLSLNMRDVLKGLIMTVIGTVITVLIKVLEVGAFPSGSQWKAAIIAGLATGAAYLLKNVFTNSQDKFLAKDAVADK